MTLKNDLSSPSLGTHMNDENDARTRKPEHAVEDRISDTVDSVQQRVVDSVRPVSEGLQSFVDQQKALGAEQIRGVARAVHGAAREFEAQMPGVAQSAHSAAAKLEEASSSLHEASTADLLAATRQFAREQPLVFFGGAVLAGFALSRFLKSSAERSGA